MRTSDSSQTGSIPAWTEHYLKEKWADYVVFIYIRYEHNVTLAFLADEDKPPWYFGTLDLLHISQNGTKIEDPQHEYGAGIPILGNNYPQQDDVHPAAVLMNFG